jgi:hypothetical protein
MFDQMFLGFMDNNKKGWPNEKGTKKGRIEYDFKDNFNILTMYRYYGTNYHRKFQIMGHGL